MNRLNGLLGRVLFVLAILCAILASGYALSQPSPTKTGIWGLMLIKHFEGIMLCKYDDGVGVITIGYGHTKTVDSLPECITARKADALLAQDLKDSEWCIKNRVDVPLESTHFDALSSFTFNLGCGNLSRSTLLRKLNIGRYDVAANEFPRWNRAGGRVLRGLTIRRNAEKWLFEY